VQLSSSDQPENLEILTHGGLPVLSKLRLWFLQVSDEHVVFEATKVSCQFHVCHATVPLSKSIVLDAEHFISVKESQVSIIADSRSKSSTHNQSESQLIVSLGVLRCVFFNQFFIVCIQFGVFSRL
jgi:hypothetical protein